VGGRAGTAATAAPSEHRETTTHNAARVHVLPDEINRDAFVFDMGKS
jgi:hypothetical protein